MIFFSISSFDFDDMSILIANISTMIEIPTHSLKISFNDSINKDVLEILVLIFDKDILKISISPSEVLNVSIFGIDINSNANINNIS